MATTSRPFHTPTTAAEARKLADALAEQENALAKAQRLASDDARFTTAETILATDAVEAAADRDNAAAAWQAAAADPSATLEELFLAFTGMRSASARRAAIVAQASGTMSQVRPLRNEHSGQPDQYRYDTTDALAPAAFADALDGVVRARAESAAQAARDEVQARTIGAGEQAANKAKA